MDKSQLRLIKGEGKKIVIKTLKDMLESVRGDSITFNITQDGFLIGSTTIMFCDYEEVEDNPELMHFFSRLEYSTSHFYLGKTSLDKYRYQITKDSILHIFMCEM